MVGHETTAGVLNYALHALAHHQDAQDRLRDEIEAFGKEAGYDDLMGTDVGLEWLDAVTKES